MGQKAFRTRITLLVQAKIFVEMRNKGDMIKLVACLERERVTRWDVITKINYSLARILSSKLIKDYGGQNNNVGGGGGQDNLAESPLFLWHNTATAQKMIFKIAPSLLKGHPTIFI